MMVIPLTRNAYHCLCGCLVFDSKFKSFKGDLKLVLAFFSSVHYSFWYILWLVIFSALEAYWPLNHFCVNKSPFIMSFWLWILLRDTSFLVADPKSSAFISLWPDWPYWRKIWKASWVSFFLMIREKKCLSSSLFSGFCEVIRKVQPHVQAGFEHGDSEQFRAFVEESGLLLFPHVYLPLFCPLHWKEPIGLFTAAHILVTWLTRIFQKKM